MLNRIKQINWEDGVSESISFIMIFPIILSMFVLMIYGLQIGMTSQRIQYSTYCSTRAAVICDKYETAYNKGTDVMHENIDGYMGLYDTDYKLTYLDGQTTGHYWDKGTLIKGTTSGTIHTFSMFTHGDKTITTSLVMMVERIKGE